MIWKLFSINRRESLTDILSQYTEQELRKAIPKVFAGYHLAKNPTKEKKDKKSGIVGIKGVFI